MREFTAEEVVALYAQHTTETGQGFEPDACARAFMLTQGQPWLVNALAYVATEELRTNRTETVTAADIERARSILVERQDTHLDSLADRLRDPRVRAVIEPMIQGENLSSMPPDDLQFVIDLGLVRETADGAVEVANPIYREIIARQLTVTMRASLPKITPTWPDAEGRINFTKLLDVFSNFWLGHGEALLGSSPYNEAAPHLVLMAFLQRGVNGGGRIDREYAIGAKRLDLCVEYRGEKLGIEVKTWRESDKARDPTIEGLPQLDGDLARIGTDRGWLVLFDQRKKIVPLPERLKREHITTEGGRLVEIVRL